MSPAYAGQNLRAGNGAGDGHAAIRCRVFIKIFPSGVQMVFEEVARHGGGTLTAILVNSLFNWAKAHAGGGQVSFVALIAVDARRPTYLQFCDIFDGVFNVRITLFLHTYG